MLSLAMRRYKNHCFEICHYQQNVPQHYYLLDTLVYVYTVITAVSTKVAPQKRISVRDNVDWYYW